jgi:hypothetical protein
MAHLFAASRLPMKAGIVALQLPSFGAVLPLHE